MVEIDRSLEKALVEWKNNAPRYPLLLRGARQVGKTYLIEKFGKSAFSSFVSVNFEAQPEAIACFNSLDPEKILVRLQAILKQAIIPGKTLLFLDEIQACPQAILSLRYFKEKLPALHVIGAGSLLEFALTQKNFSFPVGRVQFMILRPLSFHEYLLARGKSAAWEELMQCDLQNPPSENLHLSMIKLMKEYFLIGGMPAAVASFLEHLSLASASQVHEILLSTYRADFSKYATPAEQKHLKVVFDGLFQMIGQQFKYSKVDPHLRSRELRQALDHLENASLIQMVYASSAGGIPLTAQLKRSHFKLLFLDIGLIQHALQVDPRSVLENDLVQINRGALAEQFVGQELLAYMHPPQQGLFYWQREKKGSDAEVDYLLTVGNHILPIEVKAGPSGKLKSLHQFIQEKHSSLGVCIFQHPLSFDQGVLYVPLYMISSLPSLIKHIL